MKKILFFSILFFMVSCQKAEFMDRDTLKIKMVADPTYIKYKALYTKQTEMLASGDFGLTQDKLEKIKENFKSVKTYDNWVAAYDKAGVKNARTYVDLKVNLKALNFRLEKKFSLITKMSPKERADFFTEIGLFDNQEDFKKILSSRRKNKATSQ
jgi:hypothetical protein